VKPVARSEIVDYVTYEDVRPTLREEVLAAKARRRIHLGAHLTLLVENALMVRYQIQEMMRVERLVREADIVHELDTYNGLLGGDGELGATLLIEIDEPADRAVKLREWLALPKHVYATLDDRSHVRAVFDPAQVGNDRLSSVQYLKFPVGGRVPVALGVDLPGLRLETKLSDDQHAALADDLAS
jgi:hypothetical protein